MNQISQPKQTHEKLKTPKSLRDDISRILVTRDAIAVRVSEIASQLSTRYEGRDLTIVAVLTGSLMFLADLIRELPLRMRIDVMSVSSYPGTARQSQGPVIKFAPTTDFAGRDVLIVDDILDSALTLGAIIEHIKLQSPASIRSCVLIEKSRSDLPSRKSADYTGFYLPDEFVVGYGLDYNHLYRNLPDICVLAEHIYEKA